MVERDYDAKDSDVTKLPCNVIAELGECCGFHEEGHSLNGTKHLVSTGRCDYLHDRSPGVCTRNHPGTQ